MVIDINPGFIPYYIQCNKNTLSIKSNANKGDYFYLAYHGNILIHLTKPTFCLHFLLFALNTFKTLQECCSRVEKSL